MIGEVEEREEAVTAEAEEQAEAFPETEEEVVEEVAEEEAAKAPAEEAEEVKYRPPKPELSKDHERLLRVRNEMNRKRPRFIRMNSWYLARLPNSWRNPSRSLDNKIRLQKKGFPAKVKVGYRNPRLVRGLHPSGFEEVLVYNVSQLEGLDPARHAVRIASAVGRRKRAEIIRRAMELGLKVLNIGGGAT